MLHLFFWIIWITCQQGVFSRDTSLNDLHKKLFDDYNPKVLPAKRAGDRIPLTLSMVPISIRDFNEDDGVLTLHTWIHMVWIDSHFSWDISTFGTDQLNVPSEEVWKPDISVYNGSPDEKQFVRAFTNVIINNTGQVTWIPPFTVSSVCSLDASDSSKDIQHCTIRLGSWTHGSLSLDIEMKGTDVDLDDFFDTNPEWSLKSATVKKIDKYYACCPNEYYTTLDYTLKLERKTPSTAHYANTVSCFAVFLGLMVFWLPPDSIQKVVVGVLVEILLGMVTLYLGAVMHNPEARLKANEKIYPLMCLVGVFVLIEILIINIARMKAAYRAPEWLLIAAKGFCQPFRLCISKLYPAADPKDEDESKRKDVENAEDKGKKSSKTNVKEEEEEEPWKLVAMATDRMCFFIALMIIIIFYKVL